MALAGKEAIRLNHNFVGTEHVLLGIISLGQGVAVNILHNLGLDLETVRLEVIKQVGEGPDQKIYGKIPHTPRIKKVLVLAAKEAKSLNHTYVGTEHILLGLLREGDGVAARVLISVGVDIEEVRREILKEINPEYPGGTASAKPLETPTDIDEPSVEPYEAYNNLTPRAERALAMARQEADRLHHASVGTEHLLLGLIKLGNGVAANVLIGHGLDLETMRLEIANQTGAGPKEMSPANVPCTPGVKRILTRAEQEARSLNHTYIGTEHLLLGVLNENEGVSARALKNLGADVQTIRQVVLKELDPTCAHKDIHTQPSETPPNARQPSPFIDPVDMTKRYDVYCTDKDKAEVVYRNVLFKGRRRLFSTYKFDVMSEFVEVEQANGQIIHLSLQTIGKFCEHGTEINGENLPPK